jgi:hypothetical protein
MKEIHIKKEKQKLALVMLNTAAVMILGIGIVKVLAGV